MKVKIINRSHHALPEYATAQSAGVDLRANLESPITLSPLERCLVPTGLFISLPAGVEAQVRPRSGLALKKGITVLNSPGTIDADYRGECTVAVHNDTDETRTLQPGDRIAQLVILPFLAAEFDETDTLPSTERGTGGFGSTGK